MDGNYSQTDIVIEDSHENNLLHQYFKNKRNDFPGKNKTQKGRNEWQINLFIAIF